MPPAPIRRQQRRQFPLPLGLADRPRVVPGSPPSRLLVVDLVAVGLVPVLALAVKKPEEQPVILHVGPPGPSTSREKRDRDQNRTRRGSTRPAGSIRIGVPDSIPSARSRASISTDSSSSGRSPRGI